MFNPPRPEIDDDIRQKAAERFIRKFPDIQEQYDESEIINQLVSASRWADDGYRMAKELEFCFSWEIDFNTVEELDSFNSFVRTALEAAEKPGQKKTGYSRRWPPEPRLLISEDGNRKQAKFPASINSGLPATPSKKTGHPVT